MSDYKKENTQMEKKLNQLPTITDKRSKTEIYQRIQNELEQKDQRYYRKKKWVPVLATLASIVVLFIAVRFIGFDFGNASSSGEKQAETDIAISQDMEESNSLFQSNENESMIEDEDVAQIRELVEFNYLLKDMTEKERSSIVTIPFVTSEAQAVIPIHIPGQESETRLKPILERLNNEMDLELYGILPSILDSFAIPLDHKEEEVTIQFSKDADWTASSTYLYLLEQSLYYLYQQSSVEMVKIEGNEQINEQYESGKLAMKPITNHPVKVYQGGSMSLLLPVLQKEYSTIKEALKEMQHDEESFHMYGTIPKEATIFTENLSEKHVEIKVESDNIANNQQTVTMIESIIATAQLFQYEKVTLTIGIDYIGIYDLSHPIETDKIINYIEVPY